MHSFILLGLLAQLSTVLAQSYSSSDIPSACQSICNPIAQLSTTCMSGGTTVNQAEIDCICKNTSFDVKSVGSLCAICVTQNNALVDSLKSISSECGFTQTSYNQATASSIAATVTVTATKPGSGQVVTQSPSASAQGTSTSTSTSKAGAPVITMGLGMFALAVGGHIGFQAV